jgi:hypothetical protein
MAHLGQEVIESNYVKEVPFDGTSQVMTNALEKLIPYSIL